MFAVDRPVMAPSLRAGLTGFVCDLLDDSAPTAVGDTIKAAYGGTDILFANADVSGFALLAKLADEEWDRLLGVNLRATFRLTLNIEPIIARSAHARII